MRNNIVLLLVIFAIVCINACYQTENTGVSGKDTIEISISKPEVCFDTRCFSVELAITPQEQARGLMYSKELPKDIGMLFVFNEEEIQSFWMKNTLIPLDMIWINSNSTVVDYYKDAKPCSDDICIPIRPKEKAIYVLELNAGTIDSTGLSIGDSVEIKI